MTLDSHHHFWRYNEADYGWIPPAWGPIRRDFLPADLAQEIATAGVDGVITVQARQSLVETEWILALAADHGFIRGVVGWVPLVDPAIGEHIDRLGAHPKLRAFRHVLQGESDDYLQRADFNYCITELTRRGLVYDLLIRERQLPAAIALVDRHPEQVFILDHIAKPRIADGLLEPWAKNIRELARRPNVACKLSGMVTEADIATWTPAQLQPYFEVALAAFGPNRLLFGSDWPVCLAGVTYARWKQTVAASLSALSAAEQAAVMGVNAARLYRL